MMNRVLPPRPKVLLAADNPQLLLAMATLLADCGAHIDTASSPEQAEQVALAEHYDLVLTTFVWSLLAPHSLCGRLRSAGSDTEVFALLGPQQSEQAEVELTLGLLRSGATQVLSLPIRGSRLHQKVRHSLTARRERAMFSLAQKLTY